MSFKIVVLAKQVPDTRNAGKDTMKEDGTVNRAALPTIFNPEDLNALEMAIKAKESIEGAKLFVLTMGPPRAAEIIRESLYRGADGGYLITDMKFAGADTLATSYTIAKAIEKLGDVKLIFAGRQAIDGDTAQVGPQTAEKLGIPQITYAEEFLGCDLKNVTIKRRLERGIEVVKAPIPAVITVHGSADECRARHAKKLMKYKYARTTTELQSEDKDYTELFNNCPYLNITEWTASDLDTQPEQLGLAGSPTKVKAIENVVLTAKDSVKLTTSDEDMNKLMKELIDSHVIG